MLNTYYKDNELIMNECLKLWKRTPNVIQEKRNKATNIKWNKCFEIYFRNGAIKIEALFTEKNIQQIYTDCNLNFRRV